MPACFFAHFSQFNHFLHVTLTDGAAYVYSFSNPCSVAGVLTHDSRAAPTGTRKTFLGMLNQLRQLEQGGQVEGKETNGPASIIKFYG